MLLNTLLLNTLLQLLDENHGTDITVIDVHESTSVTDYMVICSARSSRQVRAMAEHLISTMKQKKMPALGYHGLDEGEWALIDFADVVVHIMQPSARAFYNLEDLWQKASEKQSDADTSTRTKTNV